MVRNRTQHGEIIGHAQRRVDECIDSVAACRLSNPPKHQLGSFLRHLVPIVAERDNLVASFGNQRSLHGDGWFPFVVANEPVGEIERLYTNAMSKRITDELGKNFVVRNSSVKLWR